MPNNKAIRWVLLCASLPGRLASTARVRLWRALRELGAANLRDGVVLLPATAANRGALATLAAEVDREEGTAWLLELPMQRPELEQALQGLFDRSAEYDELLSNLSQLAGELDSLDEAGARRRMRQMARMQGEIERIDFFAADAAGRSRAALAALEAQINRRFSPQEPAPSGGAIALRAIADYRGRTWATRRDLWVDRVASAWLIRRHIDPDARFLWLDSPAACPPDALGFDFDGALFTHALVQGSERVSFEVLLATFSLETDPGLVRLGALVHYLDVGGLPMAEAAGLEAVLAGLRAGCPDDDTLLAAVSPVLDALELRFSNADA